MARKKLSDAIEDLTGAFKKVGVVAKKAAIASQRFGAVANWSLRHDYRYFDGVWASKPATFPEWRARPGLFGDKVSRAMQNPGTSPVPSQKGSCRRRRAAKAR